MGGVGFLTGQGFTASTRPIVHETPTVPAAWARIDAVRLGEGAVRHHVLLERDGASPIRFELRMTNRPESWSSVEAIVWKGRAFIGFAERVYLVGDPGTDIRCIDLDCYFSEFRPEGDSLLVADGESVTRLDDVGAVVWRSPRLSLDGVIIKTVADGRISGEGTYDPPDVWEPFVISWSDGRLCPTDGGRE